MPERELSLYEVQAALESHRWIFAKTMPDNPHEYTLRKEWQDDPLFDSVVAYIYAHVYVSTYKGYRYMQIDAGDHFYWTMGEPIFRTILINRKRLTAKET
jgi:hypothetical protein